MSRLPQLSLLLYKLGEFLGYNKISIQGNKVAGSNDTLRRCRVAFKFEDELRSLLKEYYNDPVTRQEQVMTLEMDLK